MNSGMRGFFHLRPAAPHMIGNTRRSDLKYQDYEVGMICMICR